MNNCEEKKTEELYNELYLNTFMFVLEFDNNRLVLIRTPTFLLEGN